MLLIASILALLNWHLLYQRGYLVTRVIDGDTIEVRMNGKLEVVRYILVDAPELPTRAGKEAKEFNRKMVEGQRVTLVADKQDKDRYGRLLRYVYTGGTFVNRKLLRSGHAKIMIVRPNVARLQEL